SGAAAKCSSQVLWTPRLLEHCAARSHAWSVRQPAGRSGPIERKSPRKEPTMIRIACASLFGAAFAALLVTTPAGAQSLLDDGFFDTGSFKWTATAVEGAVTYDTTLDADADPESASVRLETHRSIANGGASVKQCVPVSPGVKYFAEASIR